MNRFAELLDRLAYEPGRNNKLRLLTCYFRETDDPDRGYALAALTGALSFKHAKPGLIRDLIAARTDPVLFALSYDYVGDLSETVALMWPKAPIAGSLSPLSRLRGRAGWGQAASAVSRERAPSRESLRDPTSPASGRGRGVRAAHTTPQQPAASDADRSRHHASHPRQDRTAKTTSRWLDELDETGRWALLKLVTGAMRIGVSARLAKTAAAELGDKDPHEIELMWPGLDAALSRTVRVAGRPRRKAGQSRSGAVPPGDAGACDRGCGFCQSRCRRFHRGMEMGRHSRAGGQRPRRARPYAGAALFAQRRGHHQKLSGPAAVAASARRDRRRAAGAARRPRANLQRAAATAQPQSGLAKTDEGISDPSARL